MQILNSSAVFPPVHPMTTNQSEKLGLVMSVGILALALGAFVLLWRLSECWKSYYISRLAQLVSKFKASDQIKAQVKMAHQAAQIGGGGGGGEGEMSCQVQSTAEQPTIEQQEVSPRIPASFVPKAPRARSSTYAGTSSQSEQARAGAGGGRLRSSTYAGATHQSCPWPGQDDEGNENRRHGLQSVRETEIRSIQEQGQEQQQQRHQGCRMGSSTSSGASHSQQQTMQLQARERSRTYAGAPSPYVLQQLQQECSRPRSSTYTVGERPRAHELEVEQEESRRPPLSSSRTVAGQLPSQQQRRLRWKSSQVPGPDARLNNFYAEGGRRGEDEDVEEQLPRILPLQAPSIGENHLSIEQQRNLVIKPPSPTAVRSGMHSHRTKPRSFLDPSLQQFSRGPSSSAAATYRDRNAEDAAALISELTVQKTESDVYDYDIEGEIRPQLSRGTLLDFMTQPPSNSRAGGRRAQILLGPSSSSGHTKRSSF
ncbi:hypothetical protein AXG93_461s1020 [Marchantia polymorpha subsp. ruderalis]|uniref:Uncharacterized protein n=1 Tax=Marchantia polymorpha subsp. ruderalis TaxID=1480154 RepID=A0A176VF75_MARPO|nr:hypothetical protein AXG93_461s1020 [Marchantia polymorpha subsp. ruderalis]